MIYLQNIHEKILDPRNTHGKEHWTHERTVAGWHETDSTLTIHQFVNGNNKYLKDYNQNQESSYLLYWDANNLYG